MGSCLDPEHESKKLETALKNIIGQPPTLPTAPPSEHVYDAAGKPPVQSSSDSDSELDPAEQADLEKSVALWTNCSFYYVHH